MAYDSNWPYRVKVTVLATEVDADLTAFPVYVNLANLPAGFHTNVNQTDARDIRVTTADGETEVPREVVFYTAASDTGELHFKGNLSNTVNTDFYIYYGNAGASDYAVGDAYGRNNVWTEYDAVFHLQGTPTGSAGDVVDASGSGNSLTSQASMGSGDLTAGKLAGNGYQFTAGDWLSGSDILDMGTSDMTISTWFKTTDTDFALISKSFYAGTANRYSVGVKQTADAGMWTILHGSTQVATSASSDSGYNDGGWHHYVSRFDRSGVIQQFFNAATGGSVDISGQSAHDVQSTAIFIVGGYNSADGSTYNGSALGFAGSMDEVRVSYIALSNDWIAAEYSNQNTPTSFYTVGAQEELSTPSTISNIQSIGNIQSMTNLQTLTF